MTGPRRFGAAEWVGAGVMVALLLVGGTAGRIFVVAVLLVVALASLTRARDPSRPRLRLAPFGSLMLGVVGLALHLGRADLVAVVIAAAIVDVAVGYRRLSMLDIGASTARVGVVGDLLDVDLRIAGSRGTVELRLLDPVGPSISVADGDRVRLEHLARHRGVYPCVRAEASTQSWASVVQGRRVLLIDLDAPITVYPRAVPVPVSAVADANDDPVGTVPSRRGREAQDVRSVRPYLPGDPRRRVHWPTTARRGELTVVEVEGETLTTVELAVRLPGPTCTVEHPGSHADHLDAVTGQARYTVERLLATGNAVRLTTLELDGQGDARAVTAPVRSTREAGSRLARAIGGPLVPPTDGPGWVMGPDLGPARTHVSEEPEATAPAPAPPVGRHAGEEDDLAVEDARRQHVLAGGWIATIIGATATGFAAESGLLWFLLLAPTLTLVIAAIAVFRAPTMPTNGAPAEDQPRPQASSVAGLVPRDPASAARVVVFWVGYASVASVMAVLHLESRRSAAAVPVTLALVWCLARLPGLLFLQPVSGRSSTRDGMATPWAGTATVLTLSGGLWLANTVSSSLAWVLAVVVLGSGVLVVRAMLDAPPCRRAAGGRLVAQATGRSVVIAGVALLLLPILGLGLHAVSDADGGGSADGSGAGQGPSPAWVGGEQDTLDLRRPRPDADRIMLSVEADGPTLLRDRSYTAWDGRAWSGGPTEIREVVHEPPAVRGVSATDPDGVTFVAADVNEPSVTASSYRQRITVHAEGAMSLPAAAEPTSVDADATVIALTDGNLRVSPPLRRGATYEVSSEVSTATAADLQAASVRPVPADVLHDFARPGGLSRRAAEDVARATIGAETTYDQVRALERWLGEQVTYSLDAPLPPDGVDVIDHFLYDAQQGWCQQVATTMTLMLRELGVPARMVTGYVAREWDGTAYVVRERHAHAWVEVFFPGAGWQTFDPTEALSLAEPPEPDDDPADLDPRLWLIAGVVLAAGLAAAAIAALRRRRRRRGAEQAPHLADRRPWSTRADARLRALEARVGLERDPRDGVVVSTDRLARQLGDERLCEVGRLVERDAYDRAAARTSEQRDADRVLDELEAQLDADDATPAAPG